MVIDECAGSRTLYLARQKYNLIGTGHHFECRLLESYSRSVNQKSFECSLIYNVGKYDLNNDIELLENRTLVRSTTV